MHVEFQIQWVPLAPDLKMVAEQEVRFSALPHGVLDAELEYLENHGAILPAGVAGIRFGAYHDQTLEAVIETFFYDWSPPKQTVSIPVELRVALRHDTRIHQLRQDHYGWRWR